MSKRKGYSIFQRGGRGAFYVAWTDGEGRRRTRRASTQKAVAGEIGRSLAAEADRVRAGVVDAAEARAAGAAKEAVGRHVDAWEKALRARGNTEKHVTQSAGRVTRLLADAAVSRLLDLRAEPVQSALAHLSTPNNARHYLRSLRSFVKWCAETGRLTVDPIVAVKPPRIAGETFQRQPLADGDVAALVAATHFRASKTPFKSPDRAMYYLLLAYTGLRKSEAARLRPEDFEIEGDDPRVVVQAAYSKRRRLDRQVCPPGLLASLRTWLAGKEAGKPVFKIARYMNWDRVFKRDCAAAGITEREGFVLGLHSLRRWAITTWGRKGGLAVAQELARHSTPALTKKYMDLTLADKRRATDSMPDLGEIAAQRNGARNKSKEGGKCA